MVRSMTGFGREHRILNGREILVEIRAVNHRFYEFSAKLPRSYMYLEEKLKTLLQGKITRGKVEISVSIYNVSGKETEVAVNTGVVESYLNALRSIKDTYCLTDDLSLGTVFQMTDAFNVVKAEVDEEAVWNDVRETAEAALDRFVEMREKEGSRMKADILEKTEALEKMVEKVEVLAPAYIDGYRAKLYEKMKDILQDKQVDESRILLEAAIFADKQAIDEETVRLHSHFSQLREMLENEDKVGRKLDFLVQEINREANTMGSKSGDLEITRLVVDIKSEIEKIREQIQNIE